MTHHHLLIRGSIGPKVKELQEYLNELGYEVRVDGTYGEMTEEAIRAFQNDQNIGIDGSCGPDTWAKIDEALAALEQGGEEASQ
jgi:peptidoglycan hydrolase-like protein with peptidoglycan-binding domain